MRRWPKGERAEWAGRSGSTERHRRAGLGFHLFRSPFSLMTRAVPSGADNPAANRGRVQLLTRTGLDWRAMRLAPRPICRPICHHMLRAGSVGLQGETHGEDRHATGRRGSVCCPVAALGGAPSICSASRPLRRQTAPLTASHINGLRSKLGKVRPSSGAADQLRDNAADGERPAMPMRWCRRAGNWSVKWVRMLIGGIGAFNPARRPALERGSLR